MDMLARIRVIALLAAAPLLPAGVLCADGGPDPELREILRAAASEIDTFPDRFDAEVWLTDMSRRLARQVSDPEERIEILVVPIQVRVADEDQVPAAPVDGSGRRVHERSPPPSSSTAWNSRRNRSKRPAAMASRMRSISCR